MKLRHNRHRVPHMLNHVPPDDFIELVIGKWIGKIVQIVNNVSRRSRIDVHTNSAWYFVGATSDIKHARFMHISASAKLGLGLDMLRLHRSSHIRKQMASVEENRVQNVLMITFCDF